MFPGCFGSFVAFPGALLSVVHFNLLILKMLLRKMLIPPHDLQNKNKIKYTAVVPGKSLKEGRNF